MTRPPRADPDVCRGPNCKRPIRWAQLSGDGRRLPIDPDPVSNGRLVMTALAMGGDVFVRWLDKGENPRDLPRYQPHAATCDDREFFRNKQKAKGT